MPLYLETEWRRESRGNLAERYSSSFPRPLPPDRKAIALYLGKFPVYFLYFSGAIAAPRPIYFYLIGIVSVLIRFWFVLSVILRENKRRKIKRLCEIFVAGYFYCCRRLRVSWARDKICSFINLLFFDILFRLVKRERNLSKSKKIFDFILGFLLEIG